MHSIKDCRNNGLSQRAAARRLGISRETVRKYWDMSEDEFCGRLGDTSRRKKLDGCRDYIILLLEKYPEIRVPKIRKKLREKGIDPSVSERAFRYYVKSLRDEVLVKQKRYYAPVIEMVPGVQAQVDLGEEREVMIGGTPTRVYFAVMVLSYSRQMFGCWSLRPFDTQRFIEFHDLAFRSFGGVPEEIVYDQTKLVAIEERYREVLFNERFYEYATRIGFSPRVCEGYDPESKGKVEAGIKYVKRNFLYAEEFDSFRSLCDRFNEWLSDVANVRIHGTTGKRPSDLFEKEKPFLKPLSDVILRESSELELRRVDKTGLLSYKGNKYSVPQKYQSHRVAVDETFDGNLLALDKTSGEVIARHILCAEKGKIVKNNNHYRDHSQTISDRESQIREILPADIAGNICRLLKENNPKIYKDQLVGLRRVCRKYPHEVVVEALDSLQHRGSGLRVTLIEEFLKARSAGIESITDSRELSRYESLKASPQHSLKSYSKLGGDA